MSPSELYTIGQRYFTLRLRAEPVSNLVTEPGALGAMASIVAGGVQTGSDKAMSEALLREIRQFGMPMATRTGLMRLELRELEAYEHSVTVGAIGRLTERLQDFKLAVVRSCYRRGHAPAFAFSPMVVKAAVEQSLNEIGKGTGQRALGRDWRKLLKAIQTFDETSLNALLEQIAGSNYLRPVAEAKWNDQAAGAQ